MTSVHRSDDTRIFHKECHTLVSAGYVVHLIAPNAPNGVQDGVRTWGIPTPRFGGRPARMTATVLDVYRRARALRADLYHFHDPELMTVALLLARTGAPVVYDVHEDLVDSMPDKPWLPRRLRDPVGRLAARIEPAAANRLAAIVAATPAIEERFARCSCHVVTVNNYPQLSEFQQVRRVERPGRRAVCYVGSITAIRGIETLVDAIAMTNADLLLGGSFSPPSLAGELRASPGWSHVVNFGHVDRHQVAEIFGQAMAGIVVLRPVARYVRSQPTKMFEYMAAGLPVIASNFPLWRAIIEPNRCGICVDPLDSHAVAEAIRWITTHPQEARQMGQNGRRVVHTTYNWQPEGQRLVALYEEILGPMA